jgi:hypothetical protein
MSQTPGRGMSAVIGAGQCVVCGAPAAMGADVCERCGDGRVESANTIVVLRGEERAYARVPASVAASVLSRLQSEGKQARAVPVRYAMAALPARTHLLIAAVVLSGILAGTRTASLLMWVATPIVALGLLFAAEHAMIRPRREAVTVELPARLQRTLDETFGSLPAGTTRTLLGDVVRRARILFGTLDDSEQSSMKRDVADLVDACCGIALEHARLETMMAEFRPPTGARASGEVDAGQLRQRAEAAQELMAKRLRDASAAIAAMYVQSVESGGAGGERVAELTSELNAESSARRQAAQELEELLRK